MGSPSGGNGEEGLGKHVKVIYSVGVKLAGGGFGNIAYHAVRGIHRSGHLAKVIALGVGRTDLPEEKIIRVPYPLPLRALGRLLPAAAFYTLKDSYFDGMAARHVDGSHIFHGWLNMMSRSAERARRQGALIVTNGSSSHPATQKRLVEEEYRKYGLRFKAMSDVSLGRMSRELTVADHILAASTFVYNSMIENGIAEDKISLVPFGVDSQRFRPLEKKEGPFTALFVGTVCLRKGIQYLLAAWERLSLKDAHLLVAGSVTPDAAPLVQGYRGQQSIQFLGHHRQTEELYRRADLFVFPSIEEGSALVTYEAMASGLPIIVSDNSGSVARDGVDGYVIPIRNVSASGGLEEKIQYLYEHDNVRQAMGRAARERVEGYTWERYGDEVVAAYRRLVGEAPREVTRPS